VLGLFLAFGLTFEVPIVVVLLARFGIADVERLKASRPYVIVGAFIVAAIFTPPDVISQLLLALPLCLLYEVGIRWRADRPSGPIRRLPVGDRHVKAAPLRPLRLASALLMAALVSYAGAVPAQLQVIPDDDPDLARGWAAYQASDTKAAFGYFLRARSATTGWRSSTWR